LRIVAAVERQRDDGLVLDDLADRRRFAFQDRRSARDIDRIGDGARLQREIQARDLFDLQRDVGLKDRLEAFFLHADMVTAGLQECDGVIAFAIGHRLARHPRRLIGHRNLRAGDDCPRHVYDASGDLSRLSKGGAVKK